MENPTTPNPQNTVPQIPRAVAAEVGLGENAMAALGYFCGIAAIVALVAEPYKNSPKSRFHALQALAFQVSGVLGYVVLGIMTSLFTVLFQFMFHFY